MTVVRWPLWSLALAVTLVAGGCLTVTPGGSAPASFTSASPTATGPDSASPRPSRRPRRTPTPGLPTVDPTATAPATSPVTLPPTEPPTVTPTLTPTGPPTAPPTASGSLDFTLTPTSGSVDLESGFTPDPHTVSATGGGPVDVSYLGGGCVGFATSEPTYEVIFTSGTTFDLLRFYYVAGLARDSTMVVNDPAGAWFCSDDSFGTVSPTVDFSSPSAGTYDIWVAAFVAGTDVAGTLSITEDSDNHP